MQQTTLVKKIKKLKKEKKAIILAHNYQRPEVQDIADFVGDSLELALCASQTDAKIIVFCGVSFMAETAAILNPKKKVLIPDKNALCPMATMLPAELIKHYRKKYPKAKIVLYINSLAEAKSYCDAVCTSANSAEIINKMDSDTVLFGPDENLAQYSKDLTAKKVIPIPSSSFCPVHKLFNKEEIKKLKKIHPDAIVLAHPECTPEIWSVSDFVGSTSKMFKEVLLSPSKKFIVATEKGLLHRMANVNMRLHTLEKIYLSLKNEKYEVLLSPRVMKKARKSVEFMLKTRETQM
jgi:quinolinate synthase